MVANYSIKEIAEDVVNNGSLTKEDVQQIKEFIEDEIDIDVLIELLAITHDLDWKQIHNDIIELIVNCIRKLFYDEGTITDRNAVELIALFDPEESLNPFERKALSRIKSKGHYGKVLRDFMDDHSI
jgi:hypothetical protein